MYHAQSFANPDQRFGPLQIVHDFQFVALNLTEDFNWPSDATENDKIEHIRWRLQRLADRGYGGIVLNVAFRNYLQDKAAWARLVQSVDLAAALGLRIWIYDEQYYPSGSAGGLTLQNHPEYEAQALVCVTRDVVSPAAPVRLASPCGHSSLRFAYAVPLESGQPDFSRQINIGSLTDAGGGLCWDCPGGSWRVYCFFTRSLYEGTYLCRALRAPRRNISVCDPPAFRHFLDITFDAYENHLGARLGSDIEAVFTDEPSLFWFSPYPAHFNPAERFSKLPSLSTYEMPNLEIPFYPYIHWTADLADQFGRLNGYPLADSLPLLFHGGFAAARIRLDYYQTLNQLFDQAYSQQYIDRMRRLRMAYSGHMIMEENFAAHPQCFGDIVRNLGRMDIPGCDLLFSDPAKLRYSLACKLASSAAHLYGRPHVMIEASNMCDQDQTFSLARLLCAMAIEFAHGVDTITSYYGENLLTEAEYRQFATYVARLGALLDGGIHQSQALVYYPFRQIAAQSPVLNASQAENGHEQISRSLTQLSQRLLMQQVDFDFINDEKLLECRIGSGCLLTPNGEKPHWLLFPEIDALEGPVASLVRQAAAQGVHIGFLGDRRAIDGLEQLEAIEFLGQEATIVSQDLLTAAPCPELIVLHRQFDDYEIYLLVNTSRDKIVTTATLPVPAAMAANGITCRLTKLDLADGRAEPCACQQAEGRLTALLALPPQEAMVWLIQPDQTGDKADA